MLEDSLMRYHRAAFGLFASDVQRHVAVGAELGRAEGVLTEGMCIVAEQPHVLVG